MWRRNRAAKGTLFGNRKCKLDASAVPVRGLIAPGSVLGTRWSNIKSFEQLREMVRQRLRLIVVVELAKCAADRDPDLVGRRRSLRRHLWAVRAHRAAPRWPPRGSTFRDCVRFQTQPSCDGTSRIGREA